MPRLYTLTVVLSFFQLGCSSSTAAGPDESKEPPLEFVVNVGDKSITITEGKTAQLDGTFANPQISVKPQPYRVFPYGGITFKYPRSFAFEADLADPDRKNWTLSGNDLKLMYFVLNARLTTAEFANNMFDQFGRENCTVTDANARIILGKQTLSGTTIQITVALHKMVMDTSWMIRLVAWDGALPAAIWSLPFLVRWLIPNSRAVIEMTALLLPIVAFFIRYHVGKRYISSNDCRALVRRVQVFVLCVGLVVLALINGVMVLTHVMPKGFAFATTGDIIVWAALYSTCVIAMAFALYPGCCELSASPTTLTADSWPNQRINQSGGHGPA